MGRKRVWGGSEYGAEGSTTVWGGRQAGVLGTPRHTNLHFDPQATTFLSPPGGIYLINLKINPYLKKNGSFEMEQDDRPKGPQGTAGVIDENVARRIKECVRQDCISQALKAWRAMA